jgi:hypothetical protein
MSYVYGGLTLANVGDIITQTSVSTNFEKVVENSAGTLPPAPSAITGPRTGQLWYDTTAAILKINSGTPAVPVWDMASGGVTISDTAPLTPTEGSLWYDSLTTYRTYVWSTVSSAWIDVAPTNGVLSIGDLSDVDVSSNPPVAGESIFMWDATGTYWVPGNTIDASPTGGTSNDF